MLKRWLRQWWVRGILVFLVLMGILVPTRDLWLPLPATWLHVTDPLEKADTIFVLSGHTICRAPKAAELFRKGYAPRLLVPGGYYSDYLLLLLGEHLTDAEVAARILIRLGVPREAMTVVKGGTSTYEEALILREYIEKHQADSIIVVTSHLQSRRARWTFRKVLRDRGTRLLFVEAANPTFTAQDWWRHEEGLVTVFNEYVKIVYYLLRY